MANFDLSTIRHSAAHVMAAAVKQLYPDAKFDIGPATENGFYYDVDLGDRKIAEEDLAIRGPGDFLASGSEVRQSGAAALSLAANSGASAAMPKRSISTE